MYTHAYKQTHTDTHLDGRTPSYIHMSKRVCMHVCASVCMHVCACVCMSAQCIHACLHLSSFFFHTCHMLLCIHTCVYTRACTSAHMCARACVYTHIPLALHPYTLHKHTHATRTRTKLHNAHPLRPKRPSAKPCARNRDWS